MPEQAAGRRPQSLTTPWRRHRVIRAGTGHDQVLEERADRRDPAIHRGRRCSPLPQRHHLPAAVAAGALPVNPGEDVHRHHTGQADALDR